MRIARAVAFAFALAATGCGTAVFDHRFDVTVNDPCGRLGPGPVDVSIFDKVMGYSEEWARKTMGTATSARPYSGTVSATATRWITDCCSLPPTVVAGLALPAIQKDGYFVVDIQPEKGS